MLRVICLLSLVCALCVPALASAQLGRWDDEESESLGEGIKAGRFRPFLEVDYGAAKPRFEGLSDAFRTIGSLELKLGFAARDEVRGELVSLDERYVFAGYLAEGLWSSGNDEAAAGSEFMRFGGGNRLGYGFGVGGVGLDFYNQNAMNWTRVEPGDDTATAPDVQAIFDRYGSGYRFGQAYEAGVKIRVMRSLSVSVGAEGAVIYPRHVFWPWLRSAALYSGVQGLIQLFSEQIVEDSPVIGSLLDFVLKTGVSLGYYLASRNDMNWPFTSETPLTIETLRLGAAVRF